VGQRSILGVYLKGVRSHVISACILVVVFVAWMGVPAWAHGPVNQNEAALLKSQEVNQDFSRRTRMWSRPFTG